MIRVQAWHRPRFIDPPLDPDLFPDRWFATPGEVDDLVAQLCAECVVPQDPSWELEVRHEDVEVCATAAPVVFVEEEAGALQWVWTAEGDASALVAFWQALPSMTEPDWMHAERLAGRLRAARFLGSPGYARVEGHLIHVARPWTAHVWREHDSWLRPPLPTLERHLHRGAVLPVLDESAHFEQGQVAYREAGTCGRMDFSVQAFAVCVPGEPFGDGHRAAGAALRLGARNGIDGPAMEIMVDGVSRVVPAARELRWDGEQFVCVPAAVEAVPTSR